MLEKKLFLFSQIPENVNLLHSLQELDLRLNYVTSLPVDSLMCLLSLRLLDVRDNYLPSIEVSKLNVIQLLHANGNHLRVLVLNGGEVKHIVAQSNREFWIVKMVDVVVMHVGVSRTHIVADALDML